MLCGLQLPGTGNEQTVFKGKVADVDQSKVWPDGTCLGIDPSTNQPTDIPIDCAAPHAMEVTGTVNLLAKFPEALPPEPEQDAFITAVRIGFLPQQPVGHSIRGAPVTPEQLLQHLPIPGCEAFEQVLVARRRVSAFEHERVAHHNAQAAADAIPFHPPLVHIVERVHDGLKLIRRFARLCCRL